MEEILVKEREVVVPGQELVKSMDFLPTSGCYRDGDFIVSSFLGLMSVNKNLVKVIPLAGKYNPKVGDVIIGRVKDMSLHAWFLDINCAYDGVLLIKEADEFIDRGADLSKYYDFNDVVIAKIINVNKLSNIDITTKGQDLRKIKGGKIIEITPSKVPRIIGKQGSMVSLIKEKTGCKITVGQNGRVWIQGDSEGELLATQSILMIEQESHIEGLTDKINKFLEGKKK